METEVGSTTGAVSGARRGLGARRIVVGTRFRSGAGFLLLGVLAALALRVARLGFQPLWWDEGYSAWFATHSLGQMAALTASDIHPPLYYALLHLWTLVAGPGPISLRVVSVAAGVAAIPVMFAAARRILGSRFAALLAAFLLAVNPLHVYYSQEARMYGLMALLSTGVLWAAWDVFHREDRRSTVPALAYVVLTTLALYTQYYAVFLPIGLTVYALWRWRKLPRALLRWFGLQAIIALLYLPWVVYAGPRLTLYVSQKVVQDADRPLGLIAYFARHLAAFAAGHLEGPLAAWWPLALLLLIPVGVGLVLGWRRADASEGASREGSELGSRAEESPLGINARAREQRPVNRAGGRRVGEARGSTRDTVVFLATVLLVALFLGWLIGLRYPFFPDRGERLLLLALPAFVMLVAAGLAALLHPQRRETSGVLETSEVSRRWGWAAYIGLGLILAASAASLAAFYTVPRYPGDDYRPLIARTVEQGQPGDTVFCIYPWQVGYWRSYAASSDGPTAVLAPAVEWGATLRGFLNEALNRGRVWFPAHLALGGILETQAEQYLASAAIPFANTWYGPGTRLSAWQALPSKETNPSPSEPATPIATYPLGRGNELALVAAPPPTAPVPAANAVTPVTLAWHAKTGPELAVSVRLVDDLGQIWAQNDYEPLGAMVGAPGPLQNGSGWQSTDRFGLLVPAGTPPGRYGVELVVLPEMGANPLTAAQAGRDATSSVRLFDVEVTPADRALTADRLPVTERESIDLGDGLRFLGYTVDSSPLAPGDLRRINLFWQATSRPKSDYTAFVQLLGRNGSPIVAWEAAPGAAYPTSQWAPGTLIRTQASLRPGAEVADGRYPLIAGLYRPADGARLKTPSGKDSVSLGSVSIKGRPRQTTPPQPGIPAEVTFGSTARLIGYDVSGDAQTPRVTLYWEALGASDRPYTVFVHLLDAQGQVIGYGDSEPGGGAYPMTGWRGGEYLTDEHTVAASTSPAPTGPLRIAVGLYDPATGQRLLTSTGEDSAVLPLRP